MNIIIAAPAFPLRGGIANFSEALAIALNKQQHTVEIASYTLQYPAVFFPGKTQYTEGEAPQGFSITPLINSVNPVSWWKTANYILKAQPDVCIIMYWMPFMAPALGAVIRKIKQKNPGIHVMIVAHNIIPHESFPLTRQLIRYLTSKADSFITLSGAVKKDLEKIVPKKPVKHLFHPVYSIFGAKQEKKVARAILDLDFDEKYLLFFGIVRKYKGLELLLHALHDQKLREMNVKLIVAGEFYESVEEYLNIIRELKLGDRVILKNQFIRQEDVKDYFAAADMVVQPYLTATQSGVTQIAYHFEKPILVTNVGGLGEIVPHKKAGYVTAIDAEDIAGCIADFYLHNRENEFIQQVKEEKKRFTWEHFSSELIAMVKQV